MATPDPSSVPHFPVYTLALSVQDQTITLNGLAVTARRGEDLQAAGLRAVVELLELNLLPSARVAVIDKDTAGRWEMAIWDTGEAVDLTALEQEATLRSQRRHKRRRNIVLAVATIAVLGVSAAVAVAVINRPAPVVSLYQPIGAGATFPAAPAPSFASTAKWTADVAPGSTTQLLDGLVLTAGTDGTFQGHAPDTGEVIWSAAEAPENISAVRLTSYNGEPVLTAATQSTVTFWPRSLDPGQSQATPFTVEMAYEDVAHLDSPQPYISLGDWYIKVPRDSGMEAVMIPPGSLPALVREDGAIVTVSASTLYVLDNTGKTTDTKPFAPPKGVSTMPTQARALDANKVLLSWEKHDALAILDTSTGLVTPVAMGEASLPGEDDPVLVDSAASTVLVGSTLISTGASPSATTLPAGFTPTTLHGGIVYGTTSDGPGTVTVGQPAPEPKLWPAYTDADPAPAIVTDDAIYLVATQLEQSKIYRLDRKH